MVFSEVGVFSVISYSFNICRNRKSINRAQRHIRFRLREKMHNEQMSGKLCLPVYNKTATSLPPHTRRDIKAIVKVSLLALQA